MLAGRPARCLLPTDRVSDRGSLHSLPALLRGRMEQAPGRTQRCTCQCVRRHGRNHLRARQGTDTALSRDQRRQMGRHDEPGPHELCDLERPHPAVDAIDQPCWQRHTARPDRTLYRVRTACRANAGGDRARSAHVLAGDRQQGAAMDRHPRAGTHARRPGRAAAGQARHDGRRPCRSGVRRGGHHTGPCDARPVSCAHIGYVQPRAAPARRVHRRWPGDHG